MKSEWYIQSIVVEDTVKFYPERQLNVLHPRTPGNVERLSQESERREEIAILVGQLNAINEMG